MLGEGRLELGVGVELFQVEVLVRRQGEDCDAVFDALRYRGLPVVDGRLLSAARNP